MDYTESVLKRTKISVCICPTGHLVYQVEENHKVVLFFKVKFHLKGENNRSHPFLFYLLK